MFRFALSLPRPALSVLGLAALVLSACGPLGLYHKAGGRIAHMDDDMDEAEEDALE